MSGAYAIDICHGHMLYKHNELTAEEGTVAAAEGDSSAVSDRSSCPRKIS